MTNEISTILEPLEKKVALKNIDEYITGLEINSVSIAESSGMLKDEITFLVKKLETTRDIKLKPFKTEMDAVKDEFNPVIDLLKSSKIKITNKLSDYMKAIRAEQRKRDIESMKAVEPTGQDLNSLMAEASKLTNNNNVKIAEPVVNIKTRKLFVIEIQDVKKIPEQFLNDMRVLDAIKTAIRPFLMQGKQIPGVVGTYKDIAY